MNKQTKHLSNSITAFLLFIYIVNTCHAQGEQRLPMFEQNTVHNITGGNAYILKVDSREKIYLSQGTVVNQDVIYLEPITTIVEIYCVKDGILKVANRHPSRVPCSPLNSHYPRTATQNILQSKSIEKTTELEVLANFPRSGQILLDTPDIEWMAVENAIAYVFELQTNRRTIESYTYDLQTESRSYSIAYPFSNPLVAGVQYSLKITAKLSKEATKIKTVTNHSFSFMLETDLDKLKADKAKLDTISNVDDRYFARTILLSRYSAFHAAEHELSKMSICDVMCGMLATEIALELGQYGTAKNILEGINDDILPSVYEQFNAIARDPRLEGN